MEKSKAQLMYEEYRSKFAAMYHHSIEKATECQQVKSYKAYIERVHSVKIDESVVASDVLVHESNK